MQPRLQDIIIRHAGWHIPGARVMQASSRDLFLLHFVWQSGWACERCGQTHTNGFRWHCKDHSEDFCLDCFPKASVDTPNGNAAEMTMPVREVRNQLSDTKVAESSSTSVIFAQTVAQQAVADAADMRQIGNEDTPVEHVRESVETPPSGLLHTEQGQKSHESAHNDPSSVLEMQRMDENDQHAAVQAQRPELLEQEQGNRIAEIEETVPEKNPALTPYEDSGSDTTASTHDVEVVPDFEAATDRFVSVPTDALPRIRCTSFVHCYSVVSTMQVCRPDNRLYSGLGRGSRSKGHKQSCPTTSR